MTTKWSKKLFHDCVAYVCLTFGTTFLVFEFFMEICFLMGVMTLSLALPIYF